MMAVIDTNVLLVANDRHQGASLECVEACIQRLRAMQESGITVIDDGQRILTEYKGKTCPNQPKGPGDVYLKWLLRNTANPKHVEVVRLTELAADRFAEFPDAALELQFDPSDRKFAAVANAHPCKPVLLQAADCKWLGWWEGLQAKGVKVEFLCPKDVRRFHRSKFPGGPCPPLPEA